MGWIWHCGRSCGQSKYSFGFGYPLTGSILAFHKWVLSCWHIWTISPWPSAPNNQRRLQRPSCHLVLEHGESQAGKILDDIDWRFEIILITSTALLTPNIKNHSCTIFSRTLPISWRPMFQAMDSRWFKSINEGKCSLVAHHRVSNAHILTGVYFSHQRSCTVNNGLCTHCFPQLLLSCSLWLHRWGWP